MSIASCQCCGTYTDTDFDCEAYSLMTDDDKCIPLEFAMCSGCREAPDAFLRAYQQYQSNPHFIKWAMPQDFQAIREQAQKVGAA